jgi:hypothetical protein
MAKFYAALDDRLRGFIARQKVFFTATAPRQGRINLSPKGMDTLRCLDDRTVAYLDLTGSGNETAAHLGDDGRLTLMFCSFEAEPLILRLYGRGEVVGAEDARFGELAERFPDLPGRRQVILLHVQSVQTSCGFGVPLYRFEGERETLRAWAQKKGEDDLAAYREAKNRTSIDGLPTGLT